MDVDSAPTRMRPLKLLRGTIDFTAGVHRIDLRSINPTVLPRVHVALMPGAGAASYRIVLGDSTSYDEKIIMVGRAVARDSIVGTWSETILCCSATGRFSLWRAR
jgi:hypothetical protein